MTYARLIGMADSKKIKYKFKKNGLTRFASDQPVVWVGGEIISSEIPDWDNDQLPRKINL
jgi:hypothetical protein